MAKSICIIGSGSQSDATACLKKRYTEPMRQSKLNRFIAPAGFICICLGIVLFALLHTTYPTTATKATQSAQVTFSPNRLKQSLSPQLLQNFPMLHEASQPDATNTLGYQPSGYSFRLLLPMTLNSLTFVADKTATQQASFTMYTNTRTTIDQFFAHQGLNRMATTADQSSLLSSVYFYGSQSYLCQVTIYTVLDVTCADVRQLIQSAQQLAPLVALYNAAEPDLGTSTVDSSSFMSSQTPGYSLAVVTISNSIGQTKVNFYRSESVGWQMVNLKWYNDPHQDAQITPNCEYFESVPSIRAAYTGTACYDSTTRRMRSITT